MKRLVLAAILLAGFAASAPAKPILIVTCGEPKGPRLDYGGTSQEDRKLEKSQDRYMGVDPVFIVDDESPSKMIIIWGNTKSFDEYLSDETNKLLLAEAQEAHVILNTDTQISAVLVAPKGANIYTLYPTMGFGYFTFHSNTSFLGEFATSMTLHADCKFSP